MFMHWHVLLQTHCRPCLNGGPISQERITRRQVGRDPCIAGFAVLRHHHDAPGARRPAEVANPGAAQLRDGVIWGLIRSDHIFLDTPNHAVPRSMARRHNALDTPGIRQRSDDTLLPLSRRRRRRRPTPSSAAPSWAPPRATSLPCARRCPALAARHSAAAHRVPQPPDQRPPGPPPSASPRCWSRTGERSRSASSARAGSWDSRRWRCTPWRTLTVSMSRWAAFAGVLKPAGPRHNAIP